MADKILADARSHKDADFRGSQRRFIKQVCAQDVGLYLANRNIRGAANKSQAIAGLVLTDLLFPQDRESDKACAQAIGVTIQQYRNQLSDGKSWEYHVNFIRDNWFTRYRAGKGLI